MDSLSILNDVAGLGAAGVIGVMWLWERRTAAARELQLSESHARIQRDEQRLESLTAVIERNTDAIARFAEVQREVCQTIQDLRRENAHDSK